MLESCANSIELIKIEAHTVVYKADAHSDTKMQKQKVTFCFGLCTFCVPRTALQKTKHKNQPKTMSDERRGHGRTHRQDTSDTMDSFTMQYNVATVMQCATSFIKFKLNITIA